MYKSCFDIILNENTLFGKNKKLIYERIICTVKNVAIFAVKRLDNPDML